MASILKEHLKMNNITKVYDLLTAELREAFVDSVVNKTEAHSQQKLEETKRFILDLENIIYFNGNRSDLETCVKSLSPKLINILKENQED